MRTLNVFIIISLCFLAKTQTAYAYFVLGDLDFDDGAEWEMAGLSLWNVRMLPIQQEFKAFVVKDKEMLKRIQQQWNFDGNYDDYCEWHYTLKFYRDKKVVKTLKVNLLCNYITDGVLSYDFNPDLFYQLKTYMYKQPWYGLTYYNLENLRMAAQRFNTATDLYLYTDIRPYLFDGHFVIGYDSLPWLVDRDSLQARVEQRVKGLIGSEAFHIQPHIIFLYNNYSQISIRYNVYCNQTLYYTYKRQVPQNNVTAAWREHFAFRGLNDPRARSVRIVVIGLTRERYAELMQGLTPVPLDEEVERAIRAPNPDR